MVYKISYSEKQRLFHFSEHDEKEAKGWVTLGVASHKDCIAFTEFMDKKYVDGRQSGTLPEFKIVKLEFELYFELLQSRRKLAGRI